MNEDKKARALTTSPNAAARMQELLRQSASSDDVYVPANDDPKSVNTQIRTYLNKDGEPAALRKKIVASGEAGAGKASYLAEAVSARLAVRRDKETTVRLSVDVSEALHERIKVYCAKNRTTTRAVAVALLESLMDAVEGEANGARD